MGCPNCDEMFDLLKERYEHLRNISQSRTLTESFSQDLAQALAFVEEDKNHMEHRVQLCGIFRCGQYQCIYLKKFSSLIKRSKSGVNSGFQRLGYTHIPSKRDTSAIIKTLIPYVLEDTRSVRFWSVRIKTGPIDIPPPLSSPYVGIGTQTERSVMIVRDTAIQTPTVNIGQQHEAANTSTDMDLSENYEHAYPTLADVWPYKDAEIQALDPQFSDDPFGDFNSNEGT